MANMKISQLPTLPVLDNITFFEVAKDGASFKVSFQQIQAAGFAPAPGNASRYLRVNPSGTGLVYEVAATVRANIGANNASNLTTGVVALERGGLATNMATVFNLSYVRRGPTGTFEGRTPAMVLADISAAAAVHTHDASTVMTTGVLPLARGGLGINAGAEGSYLRIGPFSAQARSPAQVRTDIGADDASNLAIGWVPPARGGLGTDSSAWSANSIPIRQGTAFARISPSEIVALGGGDDTRGVAAAMYGPQQMPSQTARWFTTARAPYATVGTQTGAANRLIMVPYYVGQAMSLSEVSIQVTGASAGAARLVIYPTNDRGWPVGPALHPTGNPLTDFTDFATNTTGLKSSMAGTSLMIQPGLYWIGVWMQGSPTLQAIPLVACTPLELFNASSSAPCITLLGVVPWAATPPEILMPNINPFVTMQLNAVTLPALIRMKQVEAP